MKNSVNYLLLFSHLFLHTHSKHFSQGDPNKITCPKYTCGRVPSNFCTGSGDNTLYAAECPPDSYCSPSGTCALIKTKYQDSDAYPGELCSPEQPCKSGVCSLGTCLGKSLNEKCNSHLECEPGLRCHHTCKTLFSPRDRGCLTDFDCAPNSGCNFGECTEYFSLTPGTKLEICENFSNLMCRSSVCQNERCIREQFSDDFPKECFSDSDCVSQDGIFVACVCGANEGGKSFCLPFPGDVVGKEYFKVVQEWLGSAGVGKCNTQRRFASHCMNSHWGKCLMAEFWYRAYRYQYFPMIIENPICVEKGVTQDYWKIREVFKNGKKEEQCDLS